MHISKREDYIGIILFFISLIFLLITTYIAFTKLGMWYDEIVSYDLAKHSISDIIMTVSGDVHPPGYYIIYKLIAKAITTLNITNNYILIGKFVSILPFYLLFIISLTKIRKEFGWLTTGLFSLTLIAMPQMMNYAVELRMYSWGLFFVTSSFIVSYNILKNENKLMSWTILTILTIFSSYMHYFSLLTSATYIILLLNLIKNNKSEIKYWIVSSVICIVGFIPWSLNTINQINSNNGIYWIKQITFTRGISILSFIFSPKNEIINGNQIASVTVLGILLFISAVVLVLLFIKDQNKDLDKKYAVYGILIAFLVPLFGIIGSYLVNPVLHPRYLIPSLGVLWLGISILLSKNFEKKYIFIPILVIILICSVVGCINFNENQNYEIEIDYNTTYELKSVFGEDNIILFDYYSFYFGIGVYYLPNSSCYMIDYDGTYETVYNYIDTCLQDSIFVNKMKTENKTIYLVISKEYDSNITLDHGLYNLNEIYSAVGVGGLESQMKVYRINMK